MAKAKRSTHRETYVRLLNGGQPDVADYGAARELIDALKVRGDYKLDPPGKKVLVLFWYGPTMEGRLLADQLTRELYGETLWAKVKVGLGFAAGVVFSEVVDVLSAVFKAASGVG